MFYHFYSSFVFPFISCQLRWLGHKLFYSRFGMRHELLMGCETPESVFGGAVKTTNLFIKLKCLIHIFIVLACV